MKASSTIRDTQLSISMNKSEKKMKKTITWREKNLEKTCVCLRLVGT